MDEPAAALDNVFWIGGATDAGKTSVARILAARHGWQVYHYDFVDEQQHERLALVNPEHRRFLDATLDERWVQPTPQELLDWVLRVFVNRWPLVLEDLLAAPRQPPLIAEGFGLTPALLAPLLADKAQAIFLIPSEGFKRASMERRNKPSWRGETSDPERARENLLQRDLMLGEHLRREALAYGFTVLEVDESLTLDQEAELVDQHFVPLQSNVARRQNRQNASVAADGAQA